VKDIGPEKEDQKREDHKSCDGNEDSRKVEAKDGSEEINEKHNPLNIIDTEIIDILTPIIAQEITLINIENSFMQKQAEEEKKEDIIEMEEFREDGQRLERQAKKDDEQEAEEEKQELEKQVEKEDEDEQK